MNASRDDDDDPLIPADAGDGDARFQQGPEKTGNGDVRMSAGGSGSVPVAGIRAYTTVLILFVVNLLNYVDRYTVAGMETYERMSV